MVAAVLQKETAQPSVAELRAEIEEFHADYAQSLDAGKLAEWPEYFTEDAFYRIRSRENAEANMPVGLVYCENRAMILDRTYALIHTAMFEPRYYRHFITNTKVLEVAEDGTIRARANYALFETLLDEETKLLQTGQYLDAFRREDGRLKLASRDCIYDSLIVRTALVYPV
jgi:anthranilate 1,2-dioxygenase small subunit